MSEKLIDIARGNPALVKALYENYQKDPASVDSAWIDVFKTLELVPVQEETTGNIQALVDAYRRYGYLAASLNPLEEKKEEPVQLRFRQEELSKEVAETIAALKRNYAGRIGFEYKGRGNLELEKWLEHRIEQKGLQIELKPEKKQMIFQQLNKSELFESYIHTRFPGQKRFSLEGAETLIPMLSEMIEKGVIFGWDEFVLGMTHRGRLNVLANILNKSYTEVFSEFDEGYFPDSFEGTGDVKYHKGFLSEGILIQGREVRISLTPNPSHLESVDPVVEGQVKARQIQKNDIHQEKVVPILTHGDAAIAGQGVVYETLQLSQLKGYSTGGTIHIVINNQIGFTTTPEDARSTRFCTDIAQSFSIPVLHVNAEDPEACVFAAELAVEMRHLFHTDVFIELICYRKYGHNEADEPAFTQPLEYQQIRSKKSIRDLYREQLIQEGIMMAEGAETEFKKVLQEANKAVTTSERDVSYKRPQDFFDPVATGVSKRELQKIAGRACAIPDEVSPHPKLRQLYQERLKMVMHDGAVLDWGMGEILAFASLLWEGVHVRLSGQDSERGTFSHRHVLLVDQQKEFSYYPLSHLKEGQGRADMLNSPLSEFAVLGFEYGYNIAYLDALVLWEAQFGDFSNAAQVIIDQYIASAEVKWGQKSTLVLLLPHGYEGQGPEHSSARLERYLSLAANDNMYICNPSTPAQYFHLLRRQVLGKIKKPLICLTPKSLLRSSSCVSPLSDFEKGSFEEILDDPEKPLDATRLVFCSGKIFYELQQHKEKGVSIIRLEQVYPLHQEKLKNLIQQYKKATSFVWAQEEPANMGAWEHVRRPIESLLNAPLKYAGREESASVAAGSYVLHKKELTALLKAVKNGDL